eukprot:NODE_91_length_21779_cov_0.171356.p14 type:complete len:165 gc:universal NODE_91_length_21779_cov_0.171356:4327-3833(-)
MNKIDTRSITVNTKQVLLLSPIKSSSMNSPSTPMTPEELSELRIKLTKESQSINDALKGINHESITSFRKIKKSASNDLLQPVKSILKKSDSMKNINKKAKFSQEVVIGTTYRPDDYDRQTSPSITAFHLTQSTKIDIRNELNDFKKTMEVHEDSTQHTVYYPQ